MSLVPMVYSSDGNHLYEAVEDQGSSVILDSGAESASFDRVTSLIASKTGSHVAYSWAKGGREFYTIDGRQLAGREEVGGCFSEDGADYSYQCYQGSRTSPVRPLPHGLAKDRRQATETLVQQQQSRSPRVTSQNRTYHQTTERESPRWN
jgi:hypothetical protein